MSGHTNLDVLNKIYNRIKTVDIVTKYRKKEKEKKEEEEKEKKKQQQRVKNKMAPNGAINIYTYIYKSR